jgi:hypothetical protein
MRPRLCILLIALLLSLACETGNHSASDFQSLAPDQKAAVDGAVRAFMQAVARDVTEQGATVWKKNFADDPAFFMANDGRLVFPNTQAAGQGIEAFARTIKHIELRWGDDLRVDVLTPNLALVGTSWSEIQIDNSDHQINEGGFFTGLLENQGGRWQFRDAHWSSIPAPVTPAAPPARTR